MCEDHDRSIRAESFDIVFQPFKLIVTELAQAAGLKIQERSPIQ